MRPLDIVGPGTARRAMETRPGAMASALDRLLYNRQVWHVSYESCVAQLVKGPESQTVRSHIAFPTRNYDSTAPSWLTIKGEGPYFDAETLLRQVRDFLEAAAVREVTQ